MQKMFVYGTLRPAWRDLPAGVRHVGSAEIRGRLFMHTHGYPVAQFEESDPAQIGAWRDAVLIKGDVLEADEFSAWWREVDAIEVGARYVPIRVHTPYGEAVAWHWPHDALAAGFEHIDDGDWFRAATQRQEAKT